MFWKRNERVLVVSDIDPSVDGTYELSGRVDAAQAILERKISRLDRDAQVRMLKQVSERLGLEALALTQDRRFRMITLDDIRTLEQMGLDTQMHTHDHIMPDDLGEFR